MATSDETLNAYGVDNPHGEKPEDVSDQPSAWDRLKQKVSAYYSPEAIEARRQYKGYGGTANITPKEAETALGWMPGAGEAMMVEDAFQSGGMGAGLGSAILAGALARPKKAFQAGKKILGFGDDAAESVAKVATEGAEVAAGKVAQEGAEQVAKKSDEFEVAAAGAYTNEDVVVAKSLWERLGTKSPYFQRWFGKSAVVDDAGEPLLVYHGSKASRQVDHKGALHPVASLHDTFDPALVGSATDAGWFGSGTYFTPSYAVARHYSGSPVKGTGPITKGGIGQEPMRGSAVGYKTLSGWQPVGGASRVPAHRAGLTGGIGGKAPAPKAVLPAYVSIKNPYVFGDDFIGGVTHVVGDFKPLPADIHDDVMRMAGFDSLTFAAVGKGPYRMSRAISDRVHEFVKDGGSTLQLQNHISEALTRVLQERGYDGAMLKLTDSASGKRMITEIVAFDPRQIKSASGNIGTFDPADVRHTRSALLGAGAAAEASRRALSDVSDSDTE